MFSKNTYIGMGMGRSMCRHDLTHKFSICLAIMAYEFEFECDLAGGPMNFEYGK